MSEYELTDEFDDENELEQFVTKKPKKGAKRGQKPIENADQIPLFQHADKKQVNCVSYIKVIKTNRPDKGYKGMLPPTSTEETLLSEFGPGIYTLQGCNDQHQIIIEQHEIYISGEQTQQKQQKTEPISDNHYTELAIQMANRQAELAMSRQESTHRETMKMVTDTSENTQKTLQDFFKKTQDSQAQYFAAMQSLNNESKVQMAQMFQQTMMLLTAGHQQTMEIMRASSERERELSNPMVMVQLLMQGLQMGREFGEANDQEPWVTALKEGGGMLQNLVTLKEKSINNMTNNPYIANTKKLL